MQEYPFTYNQIQYYINNYGHSERIVRKSVTTHPITNRKLQLFTLVMRTYNCFVTFSPDFKKFVSSGKNPVESEKAFITRLTDYVSNSNKGGRKKKGKIKLGCWITPENKDYLDSCCIEYNLQQGEFIAHLLELYHSQLLKFAK